MRLSGDNQSTNDLLLKNARGKRNKKKTNTSAAVFCTRQHEGTVRGGVDYIANRAAQVVVRQKRHELQWSRSDERTRAEGGIREHTMATCGKRTETRVCAVRVQQTMRRMRVPLPSLFRTHGNTHVSGIFQGESSKVRPGISRLALTRAVVCVQAMGALNEVGATSPKAIPNAAAIT